MANECRLNAVAAALTPDQGGLLNNKRIANGSECLFIAQAYTSHTIHSELPTTLWLYSA